MCKDASLKNDIADMIDLNKLSDVINKVLTAYSEDLKALRNPALECR